MSFRRPTDCFYRQQLDLRYQYALHTTSCEEQPLSDKPRSCFRKRNGTVHAEAVVTLSELQERLQQVANWISIVEKAVREGQPDWVGYY